MTKKHKRFDVRPSKRKDPMDTLGVSAMQLMS